MVVGISLWNPPSKSFIGILMAADWHPGCMLPQNPASLESMGVHSTRALQSTSGNAQSYSDYLTHREGSCHDGHFQPYSFKYPQLHPPTHAVHNTNLHQQALAARLHAKKLRRVHSQSSNTPSPRRARNYLKSQKYLEYRARPRRDTGKDGEAVWSDELEDAFQQGMYDVEVRAVQYLTRRSSGSEPSHGPEKVVRTREIIWPE